MNSKVKYKSAHDSEAYYLGLLWNLMVSMRQFLFRNAGNSGGPDHREHVGGRGAAEDNLLCQGIVSGPDLAGRDCWLSRDPADLTAALQGPSGQAAVMADG